MSQQGDAHGSQEDDWWRQLYDEEAARGSTAGPPSASIDAHFDSAVDAITPPPAPRAETLRLRRPTPPPPPPSWPQPARSAAPAPRRPESGRAAPPGWDPWAAAPTFSGPTEGAAEAEQPGPAPRGGQVPASEPARGAAPARDAAGELAVPAEESAPYERREVYDAPWGSAVAEGSGGAGDAGRPEIREGAEFREARGPAESFGSVVPVVPESVPPQAAAEPRDAAPVVPAQPSAAPEPAVRGGAGREWFTPAGRQAAAGGSAEPPVPTAPPAVAPDPEPVVEAAPEKAAAAEPLPWDVWNSEPTFGGTASAPRPAPAATPAPAPEAAQEAAPVREAGPEPGPVPEPVPEAPPADEAEKIAPAPGIAAEPQPEPAPVAASEPEPEQEPAPEPVSGRESGPGLGKGAGAVLGAEGVREPPPAKPWDAWVSPRPQAGPAPSPSAPTAPPPAERWTTPAPAPAPEPVPEAPAHPPAAVQAPAPVADPRVQLPPRRDLFRKEEFPPPRPPAPAAPAPVARPVPPAGPAEWTETAFGEGEVRWAPDLPPGWVAAGEDVAEVEVVGDGPPTYAAEPTAWPEADPDALDGQVADTVLDGAVYGTMTLRTVAIRGDSARYRGHPRRDALLTARFGTGDDALLLVAMASGARAADDAHRAAQDAVRWIAGAVGRSRARLADDMRGARRGSLKSGLHRLTDRCYGRLRARGEDLGLDEGTYTASVRCLLLPADPQCRIRLFFGVGEGGLFRIRDGVWQDLELAPDGTEAPFRFRATLAQPGDALLMCSAGLAEPLRGEPQLAAHLAERWGAGRVPGMAGYLADAQTRVKGYADDRTAVTVWDA